MRNRSGHSLVEVLVALVILGLVAGATVPNLTRAARGAKRGALAVTIERLQTACDRFYAETGVFPARGQPVGCPGATELDMEAPGLTGGSFVPAFLRFPPEHRAAVFGLDAGFGETVHYGITAHGRVFATQTPPDGEGRWSDPLLPVYVAGTRGTVAPLGQVCGGTGLRVVDLSVPADSVPVRETVFVTGRVVDWLGLPVAGAVVTIRADGSVTGPWFYETVSGGEGVFSQGVTSGTAQYVIITAAVTGDG